MAEWGLLIRRCFHPNGTTTWRHLIGNTVRALQRHGRISGKTDPATSGTWHPLRTAHADFSHRFNRENRINHVQKKFGANALGLFPPFGKRPYYDC